MPAAIARKRQTSREAILSTAEAAFAEHGFSGARVDDIAESSGFNKTLIFRHFGDKLGLYAEVLKHVDEGIGSLQARSLAPLLQTENLAGNPGKLRLLLKAMAETTFDYMVEHPRTLKVLNWETAEGWKTFAKIVTRFPTKELDRIEDVFRKAWRAGLLRSDFHPLIQMSLVSQICVSYLASLPLYHLLVSDQDLGEKKGLLRAKRFVVDAIVHGMVRED
ncbi:MAG: TetR/AcrR family transcriptional regulator [Spirochaetia bacterium]